MDPDQHRSASVSDSAQHTNASAIPANPEDQLCSEADSQSENTLNQAGTTSTTTSGPSPIVYGYSPMSPQLNSAPFYASNLHPMANQFAQVPVGPQLQVPYVLCPFPMVWPYYFQQPRMPLVYMQPEDRSLFLTVIIGVSSHAAHRFTEARRHYIQAAWAAILWISVCMEVGMVSRWS
jgi:hypothetical protein